MSDAIQIEFPQRDVDALKRQMESAIRYLNYDAGRALASAARFVVRSLGASTKVAPKFRDVKESGEQKTGGRSGYKSFDLTGYLGRPRRLQTRTVRAKGIRDARERFAAIRNRGLAKAAWSVAMTNMGASGSGIQSAAQNVARKARQYVQTDKQLSGPDPVIEIRNRLDHAIPALSGGPRDVSTAMERAASAMQKSIGNQLVKRMGIGRLSR
jgi:hypothetical protein